MVKVVYKDKEKSVFLSHVEAALLFAVEFGAEMLDAFFPAKYPETWWTRRLLGLDGLGSDSVRVAKYRLIQRGLVAKRGDGSCRITPAGRRLFAKIMGLLASRRSAAAWDGKWRILIFDVPEARKKHREGLRRALVDAGYLRLQDSVWVGKYPLPADVLEFIEVCDLDRHVFLFLSSTVDKEEKLRELFGRVKTPPG